ncbi:hypothetical protein [Streptomyces caniscabiei]|uniref:hypothetical protein n=1 Tax=Streptomyces caniscabiei TaxID=2746961 RepID=UPI001872E34C|nr:hypothetical protein [Streptomyces caniscabiei]MBE4761785.1 hypothetical protein [Streptomyces caniscabiei]
MTAQGGADALSLADLRRELHRLVAIADSAERPKPDIINPPDHAMAGREWRITMDAPFASRPPLWLVRTVDDPETRDSVYVAQPDPYVAYDWERELDFVPMSPTDARRLAMALLAAADRAESMAQGVTSLGAWRTGRSDAPERKQMT